MQELNLKQQENQNEQLHQSKIQLNDETDRQIDYLADLSHDPINNEVESKRDKSEASNKIKTLTRK